MVKATAAQGIQSMDELVFAFDQINVLLLGRAIEAYAEDGKAMSKKAELIREQLPEEAIATAW
jgi:hypothetical protein